MLKRQPDPCPSHPESKLVTTSARTVSEMAPRYLRQTLTQHRCGEKGCGKGLGWLYEGKRGAVREGPGLCENDDVRKSMESDRQEDGASSLSFLISMGWAFAYIFGFLGCCAATGQSWTWAHAFTLAGVTAAFAGLMAVHWKNASRLRARVQTLPGTRLGEER